MQLKGVAEQIAAVIHTAGFADFGSVASSNADEIAYKTGLPIKLSGKLHAETAKITGS